MISMEVSKLGLDTEHWEVSVCRNYQLLIGVALLWGGEVI